MPFAAASSFITKRSCISGSPPLMVKPPFIVFRPKRYFFSSSVARATVTGRPLLMRPGVGIVAIQATPHAPAGPGDDADARAVDGGAGRERMEEAHVAVRQRVADVILGHVPAETDAQLVRALRLERSRRRRMTVRHHRLRGTSG